ncbi:MAG: hypothetical protein ACRBBZ_03660 [Nitrosopumilus sp.]
MDKGDSLDEFNVAVDVLEGAGNLIQTWDFQNCEIIGYGHIFKIPPSFISTPVCKILRFAIGPIFHAPVFRFLPLNLVLASFFNTKKPRIIENHETFS